MYFLGIDNGGTGIKVAVFDEKGNMLAVSSKKTPLEAPFSGFNERDMEKLRELNFCCINETFQKLKIDPSEIVAVGCTGHGKGLYLWGKDNKPAYKGIASTDQRALQILKEWEDDGTVAKARNLSKQDVYVCQPVAILRWLKDNKPEVLENVKWIFEAKDYIRFCLTGEAFAEITDYSGTNMINLEKQDFDIELFKLFGIEEMFEKIPPLKYSTDICGYITKDVAEKTGLKEGTPVCGGMFDIDACAIAMGAGGDEDDIYSITGTWAINEYVSSTIKQGETLGNTLFCQKGKYLVDSSSPASAGNLEWFLDEFAGNQFQVNGKTDFDKINKLVAEINPEDSEVIFLPFLYGTNTKVPKACFFGLDNSNSQAHLLRAIYEGVTFCHMNHIEKLLAVRKKTEYIVLAGGVAKSDVWTQMFADVSGIPIKTIDAEELGCLGAAITSAVSVGGYKTLGEAAEKMVSVRKIIYPNCKTQKVLQEKYKEYNKLIDALEKM